MTPESKQKIMQALDSSALPYNFDKEKKVLTVVSSFYYTALFDHILSELGTWSLRVDFFSEVQPKAVEVVSIDYRKFSEVFEKVYATRSAFIKLFGAQSSEEKLSAMAIAAVMSGAVHFQERTLPHGK